MWIRLAFLAVVGFSAGVAVAGGLFSFIIGLGVISDFADRTHTGDKILLYEDSVALGGMIGNLIYMYRLAIPCGQVLLPICGAFTGVFVGCWSMALAEVLDLFPIFIRRVKLTHCLSWFILGIALGKLAGALLHFYQRW